MKYDVEIGSGVMIYVHTKFHKYWFRRSKADRRDTHTDTETHRRDGDLIGLLSLFKNKESRLTIGSGKN
jgi:hypothetical protein